MMAATIAATPATANVPLRVESNLCANCIFRSLLFGEHRDARSEGTEVAERSAPARVDRLDVLDEVPDDVAAGLVGNRVGARARIALAATLLAEARDVE